MTDIWIREYDDGEARTPERQLCLMRDAAQALVQAVEIGEQKLVDDCCRRVRKASQESDLFLSGVVHGRRK